MLFNNTQSDLVHTLKFINDYTKSIGIENIDIDVNKVGSIIAIAKEDGIFSTGGAVSASVFRKLASFTSYFVAERPITNAFPLEKIGENLHRISNHQNAIIALEIAIVSLKGAKICRKNNNEMLALSNAIKLSTHSYVDIVDALTGVTPSSGMKLVAVLLEQMAYRQNPACEYTD